MRNKAIITRGTPGADLEDGDESAGPAALTNWLVSRGLNPQLARALVDGGFEKLRLASAALRARSSRG